jgi:hypothetical protein
MEPSSWRGWDGKDYTKSFVSPYSMVSGPLLFAMDVFLCVYAFRRSPGARAIFSDRLVVVITGRGH